MTTKTAKQKAILEKYRKHIGQALLKPNGPLFARPQAALQFGKVLRDQTIWQYPILPGAIQSYIDLAASREWTMSGAPRIVQRAVEWLNNTESTNTVTGLVDYGYDMYLRRKAPDYIIIGMTAMACSDDLGNKTPPLEYIDPTQLQFVRERRYVHDNGFVEKVHPEERVWIYARSRELRAKDLVHNYANPIGANNFVSPILYLLPTAILAWLIRESDSAQIDGRKIRDIFLVADPRIADAIEEGVLTLLALWQGDSEEDVGIPIIPLSGFGNQKVSDLFARLGISEIPETLDREEFIFAYVNEIAAALGLALRHFWNNERTTNRALEVVQEQRQQQKGPSTFVRTEQRLLNRSGFLKRFGGARSAPRFAFIEETDISSMKDRATALKDIATALGMISDKLGVFIKPESLIAWMQVEDVLPNEIELMDLDMAAQRVNSDHQLNQEDEGTQSSDPDPTAQPTQDAPMSGEGLEKSLSYGEIVMNGSGRIIARRHKVYSIAKLLEPEIEEDVAAVYEDSADTISGEEIADWLKTVVAESDTYNTRLVRQVALEDVDFLDDWLAEHEKSFDRGLLNCAVHNCLNNVDLTVDEQHIIDAIAIDWESYHDS